MPDIKIYIPTLSRVDRQIALEGISPKWKKHTHLIVQEKEKDIYTKKYGSKIVIPHPNQEHLGNTRQWIMENVPERYIFFMDDDAKFYTRVDQTHLRNSEEKDFDEMMDLMYGWMKGGFVHTGVSVRQNNFQEVKEYKDVDRMVAVYIYDRKKLNELDVRFDRVKAMADFDVTLHLLELGYPNRVTYKYAWGQPAAGAKGGCSTYRTNEWIKNAAQTLFKFHPNCVKITKKESKKAWEGMENSERIDVNISWMKAYKPKIGSGSRPKEGGIMNFLGRKK